MNSTVITREVIKVSKELSLLETEEAIYFIKQTFQQCLARALSLHRVSAPLFVEKNSGMQDNLNGIERPVSFRISGIDEHEYQIVHSLAKWKRYALKKYNIPVGEGLYTDMNALRPEESTLTSGIHSVYVDQWDWEKAITPGQRNLATLYSTVSSIFGVLKEIEKEVENKFGIEPVLPGKITFIQSKDLLELYPGLNPKERENMVCKDFGAVFITGIGNALADGRPHDGRAPDYDDWTTPNSQGGIGLNGDILVWNPVLKRAFELSSMGIRVDRDALIHQLDISYCLNRANHYWHQMLLSGQLPESIGGGIGQSRLCMFFLRKQHIGEVQVSVWPHEVISECESRGISLL